jgi:adenylate cyclase
MDGHFIAMKYKGVRRTVERAHELVRKEVQLDPISPHAHADVGDVLVWKRDHDGSIAAFERAIALNGNFSDWRFILPLVLAGQFKSISVARVHRRVDPFYPPPVTAFSGPAHFMRGEYEEAVAQMREHLSHRPNNRAARVWLAATYARMGRIQEAQAEAAAVLRLLPSYTINGVARLLIPFKHAEHATFLFDGLRIAGIPDG